MIHSDSVVKRNSFLWNALYTGVNALQSAILLIAVSRTADLSAAGIITFGFALANLAMIVARYGIRNFQVTDVQEQFSFSDYFYCRICSTGGVLAICLLYLLYMFISGHYSLYKALLVLEIIVLKLIDAFEGVYIGRLQQKGRLDIGARFGAVRLIVSTILMFGLILLTGNLPISLLAGIAVSVCLDCLLIPKTRTCVSYAVGRINPPALKRLLLVGISLCLGTALHNIAGNAPKYLSEIFLTDEIQAISGYVMMPVFVITLLNLFLMQPLAKEIGETWHAGKAERFRRLITRHIGIICALTVVVAVLGIFVGLPVLSWLYRTDLTAYRRTFVFYLIGGAFYTLSEYLMLLLVATRRQNLIVIGCAAALLINAVPGSMLVTAYGIWGTAIVYVIANLAMLIIFLAAVIHTIRGKSQSPDL